MSSIRVGVLTVSDRCSRGEAEDTSGDLLVQLSEADGMRLAQRSCVPDDSETISQLLRTWADTGLADLILTTGGTGFSPRDVTPEATHCVLDRSAPGLVHAMLSGSLGVTPLAALARPAAGIRKKTIIVNFPGSKKAVEECYGFVKPSLRHAVDVLQDKTKPVSATHKALQGGKASHGHVCPHQAGDKESIVDMGSIAGRPRTSQWPMITVEEAQEIVFDHCQILAHEEVDYKNALGRVMYKDIVAKDPLPPFPASIKDGYAVLVKDGCGVRKVRGMGSVAGGALDGKIIHGEVLRINTGAPVPHGADAVVQVEDTLLVKASADGRTELEVDIVKAPVEGQDIRPVGCDIAEGETVLVKGSVMGPGEIGLLAAVGVTEVEVVKQPRVAIMSTGNELQEPGETLRPGHIRDSNKATLLALLANAGFPAIDAGTAKDDPPSLLSALKRAMTRSDILVTTGGVSMGDRDLLRQVLVNDLQATIHFARVCMKPGKPTTFATCNLNGQKKVVIGLPGNPVSATVTCHLYVLPACRKMAGYANPLPAKVRAKLTNNSPISLDLRPEYQRVILSWSPGCAVASAVSTGGQASSRLASLANANGLVMLPGRTEDMADLQPGVELDALVIGPLYSQNPVHTTV